MYGELDRSIDEVNALLSELVSARGTYSTLGAAIAAKADAATVDAMKSELPINRLWFMLDWLKTANVAGVWDGDAYTRYGITFEPQADGSVYVHGTCDAGNDAWFKIADPDTTDVYTGMYMKGCPQGGGETTYALQYAISGSANNDFGSATVITKDVPGTVWIIVRKGTEIDATFFPMIYSPSFAGSGFVKGAPSNRQLLEMIYSSLAQQSRSINNSEPIIEDGQEVR